MTLQELNELDFSNIGEWPLVFKLIVILLVCAGIGTAWYFLNIEDQYKQLERVQKVETDLRADFEQKQGRAANLDAYRNQLAEMRESFGTMIRQLPNKTEVADLLVDVSQAGLAAGLQFELFQPENEIPREFYAELPIKLRVTGTYHEFGDFVSGLAALPRIVTIHDIVIKPPARSRGQDGEGELVLQAVAKTYRYLDEEGG
jgi:type IV pilus assembly protein PilO